MDFVLLIMQIVALGCLSALCIYLISVLIRIRSIIADVERNLKELTSKAIPVFENLDVITKKIKSVTESIDEQVMMVKQSIQSIKDVADNIVSFERKVQERIEEPVLEIVSIFTGFFKGVRTFIERFRS